MERVKEIIEAFIADLDDAYVQELFAKIPAGKMLRSKLILQIVPSKEGEFLAAVIEMIHAASLLHDDVIDDAMMRRGVASINAIFGNKPAIMMGDILYSKAFFELTKLPHPIPQIVSNAVTLLSLGELLDVELAKSFNTNKDVYFDMIYKKTASLIEASAKAAAILAGKESEKYGLYGKNLGLAFQIVDDILDITQDASTLGKPALHDLKEGKSTLPYIYLYHALSADEKEKLLKLFKKDLSEEEKDWLKEKFTATGALERTKEEARILGKEAMAILDEEDERLHEIMSSLIERTY
ncbi:octaprenyl-diphosphate synthase [Nitratiruptor sp. YY08-26]|uniref:polyprenyl synthetase family protein n=1 Tax=unclassified Nitratiruptor TaxID=2624044 RepID=UPI0019164C6A|nr:MULTISPECIES: polyprenyl synthetase family protein [unclassified Nitratiruptor]BCD62397.1 octaprenyl-diphosphate synthase [Nitratiruptor sp. YY08-13]BCD66333.1 octaprenyl-diphosphate synthase [Nitratiruptor sp. YY08-26]